MLINTQFELVNHFTRLIWVLDAAVGVMLIITVSIIVWLCYTEDRKPKVRKQQPGRSYTVKEQVYRKRQSIS